VLENFLLLLDGSAVFAGDASALFVIPVIPQEVVDKEVLLRSDWIGFLLVVVLEVGL
jgi:hypothetical protein